MSISSLAQISRSGLNAMGQALVVYGNNISNSNTNGFKGDEIEFQEIVLQSSGGKSTNQSGNGVQVAAVRTQFSQGSFAQTESPNDLAISGQGFFVLKGKDGLSYTRNGAFHFDREGKMINSDGFQVMGFRADEDGKMNSQLGEIELGRTLINAKKTEGVKLFMNLDLRADPQLDFDPTQPEKTSNFSTSVMVYDTAGSAHMINLYFNKMEDNNWVWRAMAKGEEVIGGQPKELVEMAQGKLIFDVEGRLENQVMGDSKFSFNRGALPNQYIQFNFGLDKAHDGEGLEVTQYGTHSEVYHVIQDGYTSGLLTGLSFNHEGILMASYNNGENLNLARVALAKFENLDGLIKDGKNRFIETRDSGQPNIGEPQTGGRGSISPKMLEVSNTDLAKNLIDLLRTQRIFQANTRTLSAVDEMTQEILNVKRG